jgi:hypothetical protein
MPSFLTSALQRISLTELSQNLSVITRGKVLVRVYYAILLYSSFIFLTEWSTATLPPLDSFVPLWPLWWGHALGLSTVAVAQCVRIFFVGATFVGVLWYDRWYARLFVFAGIWQVHALASSFGIVSHPWYGWMFTSLIFVLLPDSIWRNEPAHETRRTFLLVIWWAQAYIMLTYTLSGIWKLLVGLQQTAAGEVSGFAPMGLAYQIADWLPKIQGEAIFGPFIITHPYIGWAMYLVVQYMQIFAIYTMIRPSLQKLWCIELVLFHFGTFLLMGITFSPFIPLLLALFFFSPFIPEAVSWRQIAFELPIVGQLLQFVRTKLLAHRTIGR